MKRVCIGNVCPKLLRLQIDGLKIFQYTFGIVKYDI